MEVFRFVKVPFRANDLTRRYRIVRAVERDPVGDLEIAGDAPDGDSVILTVTCQPVLSDAAREAALGTARRFLDELAAGWGRQLAEVAVGTGWVEQPGGTWRVLVEYQTVCANP
jgi:hypothetical protein